MSSNFFEIQEDTADSIFKYPALLQSYKNTYLKSTAWHHFIEVPTSNYPQSLTKFHL